MKFALIALTMSFLLTGCFEATFDKDLRSSTAPLVREYTRDEQAAAAREIQKHGCDPRLNDLRDCSIPQLVEFMKDYWVLRREARALN